MYFQLFVNRNKFYRGPIVGSSWSYFLINNLIRVDNFYHIIIARIKQIYRLFTFFVNREIKGKQDLIEEKNLTLDYTVILMYSKK